ncbi:MAG: hypothetical protein GY753_11820 [Gammaproteobacteria bacterium]|nr:hypothetical protein [Gammaproteobacteria bacterium]
MDPTLVATVGTHTHPGLNTAQWMVVLGVVLIVLQFVYRYLDKRSNTVILDTLAENMETVGTTFGPHIERTKRTYGIVKDLKKMHDQRDDDGRPMWYMPREMLEMQRQLINITTTSVKIQEQQTNLMEKLEEKIDMHQAQCAQQFNQLDKKTEHLEVK